MEMSKDDIPLAEYPQLANNPPPPQQYQSPPGYGAQQYPVDPESQAVQVVVQQQPQIIHASQQNSVKTQSYIVFSGVTLAISIVCCFWLLPALACTIPAIMISIYSEDCSSRGKFKSAKASGQMALGCNIAAVGYYVLTVIFVIVSIVLAVAS